LSRGRLCSAYCLRPIGRRAGAGYPPEKLGMAATRRTCAISTPAATICLDRASHVPLPECGWGARHQLSGAAVGERWAHGMDRNPRCEAREEQSGETNHDCKCAPERLPRHDIAIADCETGDEGEIERIADRPALDKDKQQASGNLNRQNGGQ